MPKSTFVDGDSAMGGGSSGSARADMRAISLARYSSTGVSGLGSVNEGAGAMFAGGLEPRGREMMHVGVGQGTPWAEGRRTYLSAALHGRTGVSEGGECLMGVSGGG